MAVTKKRLSEFDKMNEEELERELQRMHEERVALREEQLAAHEVLDRKIDQRRALDKMATLTPNEVEAIVQHVKVHGIPSEEQVQGE